MAFIFKSPQTGATYTCPSNQPPSEHESRINIQGVEIALGFPDEFNFQWIGQRDVMDQLLAAWLVIDKNDIPLNPRLIGKPGVGKTTLAYAAAKKLNKPVYIFQCTMDTRPEDLLITPVVDQSGGIRYVASALVTAMIRGGVCILDEANRMSEKSWASLAPLLDTRRYIESIVAGLKVSAHPDFRICVTMNDDASTFEIPEYIHSRLQPQIYLDFPEAEEERRILRENLPFCRRIHHGLCGQLSAKGPRQQRKLYHTRWHQYCPLCRQKNQKPKGNQSLTWTTCCAKLS